MRSLLSRLFDYPVTSVRNTPLRTSPGHWAVLPSRYEDRQPCGFHRSAITDQSLVKSSNVEIEFSFDATASVRLDLVMRQHGNRISSQIL